MPKTPDKNRSRLKRKQSSRYQGVTPTRHGTFEVRLLLRHRHVFVGTWPTEREAAIVLDRLVLDLGLEFPLNFPRRSRELGPLSLDEARALRRPAQKSGDRASRYVGVTREGHRWRVAVEHEGRRVRLGTYADEKEAAIVRDRLILGLRQDVRFLNFPELNLAPLSIDEERAALRSRRRLNRLCKYRGVAHWPGRRRAWGTKIYQGGKQVTLGMWRTARAAAEAYDRAARYFGRDVSELNFPERMGELLPAGPATLRSAALRAD